MHIVFLDEFGHIGPFVSRDDARFKTSPVFGLSGFFLPERNIQTFSRWFFKLKNDIFEEELGLSLRHPSAWEKKGTTIFTSGRVHKTKRIANTLINEISHLGGKIFYHGIEKYEDPETSNANSLYATILSHSITNLDKCFIRKASNFVIILDQHQARIKLLEGALRTMYGQNTRRLVEPPYQVESHLYQTIQAADWISSIIGPLWAWKALPDQFQDCQWAEKYFEQRIRKVETHSSVRLRRGGPR